MIKVECVNCGERFWRSEAEKVGPLTDRICAECLEAAKTPTGLADRNARAPWMLKKDA